MATSEQIERLKMRGETAKAKRAFLDYVSLGPNRSLKLLLAQYRDPDLYTQDNYRDPAAPPTRQMQTLKKWSAAYDWVARSGQVTDDQADMILREERKALAKVMQMKYATASGRIEVLNELAELIVDHIRDQGITTTVFKVAKSKVAEEVRVDSIAIGALRGLLEDLARETGGRPRNVKHRLPDGPLSKHSTIFVLPPVDGQGEIIDVTPSEVKD